MRSATLGFSPESETIDLAVRKNHEKLRDTAATGNQPALDELWDAWEECRIPGWDGYDALPVGKATLRAAYCLIDTLPYGFPPPSIGAEPDGQLTLEWRTAPYRVLSVSVDPNGYLHYAGLFGTSKRFGTLTYFSTAPAELIHLIGEL